MALPSNSEPRAKIRILAENSRIKSAYRTLPIGCPILRPGRVAFTIILKGCLIHAENGGVGE
jgi:hypothetical protein